MSVFIDLTAIKKTLRYIPPHIVDKLHYWAYSVKKFGLNEVRKVPGFHDEPLKGKMLGERSIRLSKSYRAIYIMKSQGEIEIIKVIEVNKHEY